MKQLLRCAASWFVQRVLPAGAKNSLRMRLLFDVQDRPPRAIEDFSARHVLVLAPHMDDETIGCGGTLRRHVEAGAPVTVVFLTDGSRGDPGLSDDAVGPGSDRDAIAIARQRLVARRKDEARQAAEVLGLSNLVFLDRCDNALEADDDTVGRVVDWCAEHRPDIVYLPSVLDPHRDHWAANLVFQRVMASPGRPDGWMPICREYEVWSPLVPNVHVDISDVHALKSAAVECYRSQLEHVDYLRVAQSLNAYRSVHCLAGSGFAEVFFESTPQAHRGIMDRYQRRR